MILLKANTELKHTFERLIQTMEVPVKWNHLFVVLNNYLILPGEVRSLIFNFDSKKVNTNVIEIPMAEEAVQAVEENIFVTNALEMLLYAFGKWGMIQGLRVEKDYAQLNALFTDILREVKIEPGYRNDNFRFYKNGIQVTYEDVIQAAIEAGEKKEELEEEEEEHKLGLWHNVCWTVNTAFFEKGEAEPIGQDAERIGNNFYKVGYKCSNCGKNLHMVVYPVDKEFLVETEEGRVYLARAYACDACNRFYTPRPGRLLGEGEVYQLDFEEDREAYEDYQRLLGQRGEKTSNYKFNEYESERNRKQTEQQVHNQEDELALIEEMTQGELFRLEEKLETGFYMIERMGDSYPLLKEKIARKKQEFILKGTKDKESTIPYLNESQKALKKEEFGKTQKNLKEETNLDELQKELKEEASSTEPQKNLKKEKDSDNSKKVNKREIERETSVEERKERNEQEAVRIRKKYDARMDVIERMSPRQMQELKESIKKEKYLTEVEKSSYSDRIEQYIYQYREKELRKRADKAREGNYIQLCRAIDEMERIDCPSAIKEPIIFPLYELKKKKAQTEAEQLITNMPEIMDRRRYQLFKDKLDQYKEADITPYKEVLKEKREQAERQEIALLVKRANKNDRGALFRVWERLQKSDFSKENTEKPVAELYDRIRKLDEAALDRICPDATDMSFEEGLDAYQKILEGAFLPELKTNALEMMDRRLTKMKSDESELLVKKLQDELTEKIKDSSSLYFYEARKAMRGEWEGADADIINCAMNVYAQERGKYEFPLLVCDTTRKKTGREGFLLTPDHLFYNNVFSSECIPVLNIKSVFFNTGLLNKGVYISQNNGEKTKIPVGLHSRDWEAFASVLDEFIKYLQEKPESRKISYLMKEKHEVKCCYRCGYVYEGGAICPKCGNRANNM